MVSRFQGKVVLVTGGAGGIGAAVARRFAAEGADLFLVDRSPSEEPHTGTLHCCDVADAQAVDGAFQALMSRYGRIDVLVNVAGVMLYKPIAEHTAEDWQHLLAINLIAPALFTGHALRAMGEGGAIVNISSVHARRTSALVSSYAASKAGLVSLTRSTAIEGRERGIRCNAVLPGAIETALLRASPNIKSGVEVLDPADVGSPEDVAALTLFLASEEARFITGEDIVADSGRMGRL